MRDGLAEVKEVYNKTGLTRKQLHQCDELDLVKPTKVQNDAGYKLYDEKALDKLYEVGLYASLGLSIQEIKERMDDRCESREAVLEDIIDKLKAKNEHIQNQIAVAEQLKLLQHRIPEYDSYVIRHLDEVGEQYRMAFAPDVIRSTRDLIRELERGSDREISCFLLEYMNFRHLTKALENKEESVLL